jgi:hypothetical protein
VPVQKNLLPGGNVFSDGEVVDTGQPDASTSVGHLHRTDHSSNFSGRSTQIDQGFASAQADNSGNGGVGSTNWLGITPGVDVSSQLVATALWTQTFTNTATADITLSLTAHPGHGSRLDRSAAQPYRTERHETALTQADLAVTINRADGTLEHGRDFTFGVKVREQQLPLIVVGPNPVPLVNNFAVVDPFSSGRLPINPFRTLRNNGSSSAPKYTIDYLSFVQAMGTLHPGDILSYVYALTAEGTTHGAGRAFWPSSMIPSTSLRAAAVSR